MKYVFLLHSNAGVHLITSNILCIYSALLDIEKEILPGQLKSYSWYCIKFNYSMDIAVPLKGDKMLQISKRPVLRKYFKEHSQINSIAAITKY